jgi:hypothetical protein
VQKHPRRENALSHDIIAGIAEAMGDHGVGGFSNQFFTQAVVRVLLTCGAAKDLPRTPSHPCQATRNVGFVSELAELLFRRCQARTSPYMECERDRCPALSRFLATSQAPTRV